MQVLSMQIPFVMQLSDQLLCTSHLAVRWLKCVHVHAVSMYPSAGFVC